MQKKEKLCVGLTYVVFAWFSSLCQMQENGKSSNDEVVKELIYDGNVKNNNNDKKTSICREGDMAQ